MTNEVMIKAMDNLLDKRANTDEFNKKFYNGEQTDKTAWYACSYPKY